MEKANLKTDDDYMSKLEEEAQSDDDKGSSVAYIKICTNVDSLNNSRFYNFYLMKTWDEMSDMTFESSDLDMTIDLLEVPSQDTAIVQNRLGTIIYPAVFWSSEEDVPPLSQTFHEYKNLSSLSTGHPHLSQEGQEYPKLKIKYLN